MTERFCSDLSLSGEHALRCDVRAIAADLEVAVVAGRAARAAHIADELALPHGLARTDRQRQAVGIDRGIAAGVADDHRITIARTGTGLVITRLGHSATRRCIDGRTGRGTDIHALMAAAIPA